MFTKKCLHATLLAALFFAQINCAAAQTVDFLKATNGGHITVALDPPVANPRQTTQVTPTPQTGPIALANNPAPNQPENYNPLFGLTAVVLALAAIYCLWLWNRKSSGNQDRIIYWDPYDYDRPRGRHLSDRERQELKEELRHYQPWLYDL